MEIVKASARRDRLTPLRPRKPHERFIAITERLGHATPGDGGFPL